MSSTEEIFQLVITGKSKEITAKVEEALAEGADPQDLLNNGMIAAMNKIGARFSNGEIFVPEMMIAAAAMKKGVTTLKPFLSEGASGGIGTVVIGTVEGDMHDIGKSLVGMMLESAGFEVIDLGVDVAIEDFVNTVIENKDVKLVCCSALLTTTMANMKAVIAGLEEAGVRQQVKVLIGGAPVNQEFCNEIGADGYGEDAAAAVRIAKQYATAA